MKSKMKKLVSLMLAMAMVMTMTIGMSATQVEAEETEETKYTITINNSTSGHTYEAYQIFTGTLSTDANNNKVLSDIKWGSSVDITRKVPADTGVTLIEAINAIEVDSKTPFSECTTATEVAEVLKGYTDDSGVVKAFAETVAPYLTNATGTSNGGTSVAESGTYGEEGYEAAHYEYTISVPAGYYLVKDKDGTLTSSTDEAYTSYILEVVGDAEVDTKSSVPSMTKKVKDENDSDTTETNNWQDSADYDIGDDVPFQLTATMPSTLSSYDTYSITFHDTMDAGLTFDSSSVKVYVVNNDTETQVNSSCYTIKTSETDPSVTDGHTFDLVISDVLSLTDTSDTPASINVTSASSIVVRYTAKLNSNAQIGNNGNWNKAYLEYSNNPYSTSDTSKTPEDTVVVFTYSLIINKVDENDNSLRGADFKLYKYNGTSWKEVDLTKDSETEGEATKFTATGLDDGIYKLVETATPTGYNSVDDIYFIVTATHVADLDSASETEKTSPLTELKFQKATWDSTTSTATEISDNSDISASTTLGTNATLAAMDVVNKSGSVLPSTGGIGTTIFYIVGAILVIGAGVILVTRRRTRA